MTKYPCRQWQFFIPVEKKTSGTDCTLMFSSTGEIFTHQYLVHPFSVGGVSLHDTSLVGKDEREHNDLRYIKYNLFKVNGFYVISGFLVLCKKRRLRNVSPSFPPGTLLRNVQQPDASLVVANLDDGVMVPFCLGDFQSPTRTSKSPMVISKNGQLKDLMSSFSVRDFQSQTTSRVFKSPLVIPKDF